MLSIPEIDKNRKKTLEISQQENSLFLMKLQS